MKNWGNRILKIFVLSLFLLLFLSFFNLVFDIEICIATEDKMFHVGGTGAGNYSNIQDAIDAADVNETVIVHECFYSENIFINKSLKLIGMDNPIIDGGSEMYSVFLQCSYSEVSGFTIQNSEIGVYVGGDHDLKFNTIRNNIFRNNTQAIYLQTSSHHNMISDNVFIDNFEAIRFFNSSYNSILNNSLENHVGSAIVLWESSQNNILTGNNINHSQGVHLKRWSNNNTILFNTIFGEGFLLDYSFDNIIQNNTISDCKEGFYLSYSERNNITNNVVNNSEIGIHLFNSDNNIISPNVFLNSAEDVKAESEIPNIETTGMVIILIFMLIAIVLFWRKR